MNLFIKRNGRWLALLAAATLIVDGCYLVFTGYSGFHGFPLDDAWIHQVYARNLAQRGEWAFNPGQPSGGSTAPLWSVLLAGAHVFNIDPVIWSAILGGLALLVTAILAELLVREWNEGYQPSIPWAGLFMVCEWHLVWASISGMETSLFICLFFIMVYFLKADTGRFWIAGLLIGLAIWVRPDGITFLGPAIFLLILGSGSGSRKARRLAGLLGGFLMVFVPYLFFNLHLAGSMWPSTFSAKQAEYQASTGLPFLSRVGSLFLPFLAGGGVILLPAEAAAIVFAWRKKNLQIMAILLWFCGYLLMYAIRLPVYYQHGRYMIPAMAGFFLVGLWGLFQWTGTPDAGKWQVLVKKFSLACLAAVTLSFLWLGGMTYQNDVAIITTEMVDTAAWIKKNISPQENLAAHDIGAMGYFSDHEIIDLAGLVNPEVIPIIRDEERLADYLNSRQVDFLVTFPEWYPQLTGLKEPVYKSRGIYSPRSGGENMAVYRWVPN
jgi:arabinofuranosyltransferase